jgi:hypothetical protein
VENLANLLPPNVLILLILSGAFTSLCVLGATGLLIWKLGSSASAIPVAIESLKSTLEGLKNAMVQGFSTVSTRLDNLEHRMSTIEDKMPNVEEITVKRK